MQSLDQLFAYELQSALAAEQEVASALDGLARCQSSPQLQQIFGTHLAETRAQIDRLGRVLSTVGLEPAPSTCEGVAGILREHDRFAGQQPAPAVHAAFDVGAGVKVEQYEIATYQHLVDLATALGHEQAARLLQTSLAEEREQRRRLQDASNAMDLPGLAARDRQRRAGGARLTAR